MERVGKPDSVQGLEVGGQASEMAFPGRWIRCQCRGQVWRPGTLLGASRDCSDKEGRVVWPWRWREAEKAKGPEWET